MPALGRHLPQRSTPHEGGITPGLLPSALRAALRAFENRSRRFCTPGLLPSALRAALRAFENRSRRFCRTLGTLLTYTHFPGVLLLPLGHLSGYFDLLSRRSRTRAASQVPGNSLAWTVVVFRPSRSLAHLWRRPDLAPFPMRRAQIITDLGVSQIFGWTPLARGCAG